MGKSLIPCGLTAGWRRSEMSKYCRSFTLLEIILALTILSVLTALAGTVLFASQRGWNSIQESSAELETLQRLDGIADTAFRNAVPFHWPDENNKSIQLFRGKPKFLRVAYRHRINQPASGGIRFLELFQEKDTLTARYRRYPLVSAQERGCRQEILVREVRQISFSYAVRENGEIVWHSEFDAVAAETIPLAIRMDVEFINGKKICFLRRTAGNSAMSSYGKFRKTSYEKL